MEFSLFIGCNIPARVPQYDLSARAVLDRLHIDIVDIREFNCCGYPVRNTDFKTFVLFSARNLALAEKRGRDILTLCKCCYGSLKKADHIMKEDTALKNEINDLLSKEDLAYQGNIEVKHILQVLHKDIGLTALKEKTTSLFKDLKIAVHYGCHALRPSDITRFDNPVAPVLFDQLVETTGAGSIEWPSKLECCGAPLLGTNDDLSMDLTEKKLIDARQSGADYLCSACPWCQLQFDAVQNILLSQRGEKSCLASILYTQLLGLCMGIDEDTLGIAMNQLDISDVKSYLTQE